MMYQSNIYQLGLAHCQKRKNILIYILLLLSNSFLLVKRHSLLCIFIIFSFGVWSKNIYATGFSSNSMEISIQGNLMSARIKNQPLKRVLEQITQKIHLAVYMPQSAAEENVSTRFNKLTFVQGIMQILGSHNYMMKFTPKSFENDAVGWLKILGNQSSAEILQVEKIGKLVKIKRFETIPGKNSEKSLTESIEEAQTAPEPEQRIAVLESLLGEEGEETEIREALLVGLEDENPGVRKISLERLTEMIEPIPFSTLSDMFLSDSDTNIRREVLLQLVEKYRHRATPIIQQAQKDPDETVRNLANDIIGLK